MRCFFAYLCFFKKYLFLIKKKQILCKISEKNYLIAKYLLNTKYIIIFKMLGKISEKLTTIVNKDLYINRYNIIYIGEAIKCQ